MMDLDEYRSAARQIAEYKRRGKKYRSSGWNIMKARVAIDRFNHGTVISWMSNYDALFFYCCHFYSLKLLSKN